MNLKVAIVCLCLALPCIVQAQSSPNLILGFIPTPAEWNSYFSSKLDYSLSSGEIFVGSASNLPVGVTPSGDCTVSTVGSFTCLSSNGTAFGTAAFVSASTLAPKSSPTFTGTVTLPVTGSTQCLQVNSGGVLAGSGGSCGGSGGGAVTSVFTRTGDVVASTGDYSISQITGAGTAAQANIGTSGATVPELNAANVFSALQTMKLSSFGATVQPLLLENSSTYSSGNAAQIALTPSSDATVAGTVTAYSAGGVGGAGLQLGVGSGGSQVTAMDLHSDGGVVVGSPPSGDLGSGTIDAIGLGTSGASTFASQTNISVPFDGTTSGPTYVPVFYHTCAWNSGDVSVRTAAVLQIIGCPQYAAGSDEEINGANLDGYGGDIFLNIERYDRGTVPASAGTTTSQTTLHFTNTPAWVTAGATVKNNNQGGATVGTVSSVTGTTIVLTADALVPVSTGDIINIIGTNNGAVQNGETVGGVGFDSFGGSSDKNTAGVGGIATETRNDSTGNYGTELTMYYSPNGAGSAQRCNGINISKDGLGSVTIGDTMCPTSNGSPPAGLGQGSLNVFSDIKTGDHFRSGGTTPTVSSCGGGTPSIAGTDNVGIVTTGTGTVNSCTVTFANSPLAWASAPVCIVQTYNNASPVTYVSSESTTVLTVSFSSSLAGSGWQYICQGRS